MNINLDQHHSSLATPLLNLDSSTLPFPLELFQVIFEQLSKYALFNARRANRFLWAYCNWDPQLNAALLARTDIFWCVYERLRMIKIAGIATKTLVLDYKFEHQPNTYGPYKGFEGLSEIGSKTETIYLSCNDFYGYSMPVKKISDTTLNELCKLKNVQQLKIKDAYESDMPLIGTLLQFPNLKKLTITGRLKTLVFDFRHLTNLRYLRVGGAYGLISLAELPDSLQRLKSSNSFASDDIAELHIGKLTGLLSLKVNNILSLDLAPLTNLTELDAHVSKCESITNLTNLVSLKTSFSFRVGLFNSLPHLTRLNYLHLNCNDSQSVDRNLTYLNIIPFTVAKLNVVSCLTNLTSLGCNFDYDPLRNNTCKLAIKEVGCQFDSLEMLSFFPQLTSLHLIEDKWFSDAHLKKWKIEKLLTFTNLRELQFYFDPYYYSGMMIFTLKKMTHLTSLGIKSNTHQKTSSVWYQEFPKIILQKARVRF